MPPAGKKSACRRQRGHRHGRRFGCDAGDGEGVADPIQSGEKVREAVDETRSERTEPAAAAVEQKNQPDEADGHRRPA